MQLLAQNQRMITNEQLGGSQTCRAKAWTGWQLLEWVANAGERFENMKWRLGGVFRTKNNNRKPSEVGQGFDNEDRSLRMMLMLNSYSGEGNKKSDWWS